MPKAHQVELDGQHVALSWAGPIQVSPARVYGLAFTSGGEMLLVRASLDESAWWLPGGGVEPGESPEQAIRRELAEESGAEIEALEALGSQRLEYQHGGISYHRFYWCRVSLKPAGIELLGEGSRRLVGSLDFIDTLVWGRSDPAAPLLLDLALRVEAKYR